MDEILERLEHLEQAVFTNVDAEYIRYVALSPDNVKILTQGGFKRINAMKDGTIKLFHSPNDLKLYFENHNMYRKLKYKIMRVRVSYQFISEVEVEEC